MAQYRISGVWKDVNNVITHYAFHRVWNYSQAKWSLGEDVEVVNGPNGKYLRSNLDNKLTDNLSHLIDFDWIAP